MAPARDRSRSPRRDRAEHSQSLLETQASILSSSMKPIICRNRLSQSYRLVDGLNKRFLLLLSGDAGTRTI